MVKRKSTKGQTKQYTEN